ncbi:MAG TPA: GNAT family N-acetyltransferase [Planctomycetota bacterium]|nr:GNAT family N-acetyltransferase [Planctomycetota bacterium]
MYQKIQDVTLRNGEAAEMGILLGPDTTEWGKSVRTLLGHKGEIWRWQVDESLNKQLGCESRFYILSKACKPFANIMIVEDRGIAIFGHVWTVPEERRKGAADIIHAHLMEDFKRRGGRAMYLGTGYDTHPYHLYAKHGFQGVEPKSGYMTWFAKGQQAFESEVFAKGAVRHEALEMKHWPTLPALAMMKHPARIRIAGMNILNVVSTEGGALPYLSEMSSAAAEKRKAARRAWVAVSQSSGVPVAIAAVAPEAIFEKQGDILDVFCAPGFEPELPKLVQKLELDPNRGVVAYADPLWPAKYEALKACGLQQTGSIKRFLSTPDGVVDVNVFSK